MNGVVKDEIIAGGALWVAASAGMLVAEVFW
jgi:hypothetical protein